jgi:hypothetical protein
MNKIIQKYSKYVTTYKKIPVYQGAISWFPKKTVDIEIFIQIFFWRKLFGTYGRSDGGPDGLNEMRTDVSRLSESSVHADTLMRTTYEP